MSKSRSPEPSELNAALAALMGPLRFASRGAFEHLDRVKDLETHLTRAGERVVALAQHDEDGLVRERLGEFLRQLPDPAAARAVRVQALMACQRLLDDVSRHLASQPAATSAVPAPAPQRGPGASSMAPAPQRVAPAAPQRAAAPVTRASARKPAAPAEPREIPTGPAPELDAPLTDLRGVGPRVALGLEGRGLHTVSDLLHFLPRRYQGRAGYQTIAELQADAVASVEGIVHGVAMRRMGSRSRLEVILTDDTGTLHLTWFRIPGKAFAEQFTRGRRIRAAGSVKRFRNQLQIVHPEIQRLDDSGMEADVEDSVVPLYLEVEGVHPKALRRVIEQALPALRNIPETLPAPQRDHRQLVTLGDALLNLHVPPATTPIEDLQDMRTPWHARLIYEELLLLQLALLRTKHTVQKNAGRKLPLKDPLAHTAKALFPFALTGAQARALGEVEHDLRRDRPMQRLLQGDVGSGKTAVALSAAAAVAQAGMQVALMAPTELLAEQHGRTALKALTPHGLRVALLTGNTPAKERRQTLAGLSNGSIHVAVGTHALIQNDVAFKSLALGIIDEQHRFGVLQRARLVEMGRAGFGATPHTLVMTATPIPRTLALTVYGDLDVSVIDELPPGRTPIVTKLYRDQQREQAYARVREEVAQGRQAYVVFPLVEESDKEGMTDLRDATSSAEELANGPLHGLRLALLHGRLGAAEKESVMRAFLRHDVDVLVATTVVEVGIDVPNSTVMVIEHAERFGLSQLHQLRGRVGRGAHASCCLLLARQKLSDEAWRRLGIMEQSNDGFRIAEEDLAMRGPGDFVGTRQSGLPVLMLANLARDQQALQAARDDAQALLQSDPELRAPQHVNLAAALERAWTARLKLAQVG